MILKKIYTEIIFRIPSEKTIYLTFDDGPTPEISSRVLSLLNDHNAKATFFCIGKNVEQNQELYNEILINNHAVGNHSYSHLNGFFTPNNIFFEDIKKASSIIESKLFRAPYGKLTPSQYFYLKSKYKIIMWDILTKDYNQKKDSNKIFKYITSEIKPGSIVVFHDTLKASENLLKVLPNILDYLKSRQFEIEKII